MKAILYVFFFIFAMPLLAAETPKFKAEIRTQDLAEKISEPPIVYTSPYSTRLNSPDDDRKYVTIIEIRPGMLQGQLRLKNNSNVYLYYFAINGDPQSLKSFAQLAAELTKNHPIILDLFSVSTFNRTDASYYHTTREKHQIELIDATIELGGKMYPVSDLLEEIKKSDVATVTKEIIDDFRSACEKSIKE